MNVSVFLNQILTLVIIFIVFFRRVTLRICACVCVTATEKSIASSVVEVCALACGLVCVRVCHFMIRILSMSIFRFDGICAFSIPFLDLMGKFRVLRFESFVSRLFICAPLF